METEETGQTEEIEEAGQVEGTEETQETGESEDLSLRDSIEEAMGEADDENVGESTSEENKSTQEPENKEESGESSKFDHPFDSEDGKSYKSPGNWKPGERELWSKVPLPLQARIKASEAEKESIIQESAQARQVQQFMNQLGTSYAPVFAAEGIQDVPTGIKGMVDTIALLQNGSPADKAVKFAQLISHYGVDIEALDSALVGEAPQNPQAHELQQLIDQKMQPVNQLLQRLDQTQNANQQRVQHEAAQEVANFKGEFLSDVRNDMADLIDMAASRGQQMTLQEAYDKAVILRPDLQKIITERKQNEEITGRNRSIGNKMNAASSISGSRGGIASGNSDSLRGAIEDAWNEAG